MPGSPPRAARERPLALLAICLGEIAAAAALVRAEGAFFLEHHLSRSIDLDGGFNFLGSIEARFFLAHLMAGLPAALLLTDAATRLLGPRPAPWSERAVARPKAMALCFALFATAAAAMLGLVALGHAPVGDGENVLVAQARMLLSGSFSAPEAGPLSAFPFHYILAVKPHRWTGVFPPGQPALLAIGLALAHSPYLLQPLFAGGTVYLASRLATELWGAETGVIAAALIGTSPLLLFQAATLEPAVPAAFFCLVAVAATHRALRIGRRRDHALIGAALGAAFLCRPFDAVAVAIPILFLVLSATIRPAPVATTSSGTAGIAWTVACATPAALLWLVANHATTGNALHSPMSRWIEQEYPGAKVIGFGPAIFGGWHTTQLMFSKALVVTTRASIWFFGWPTSLWPLLALLLGVGRDQRSRLLLAALGIHFLAFCFATTNGAQELGSANHIAEAPLVAILSARAIVVMGEKLRTFGERLSQWPGRLALACSLIALLTFWPDEIAWAHQNAKTIAAPMSAAKDAAAGKPSLLFWRDRPTPHADGSSSELRPPLPGPFADDPILWVRDLGQENDVLLRRYSDRQALLLAWDANEKPRVELYPTGPQAPDRSVAASRAAVLPR